MPETPISIEIFCSYADQDESWFSRLKNHLSLLQQQGFISLWYDQKIGAGVDMVEEMRVHLETASVILLLISADFMASKDRCGIEMQRALQRQEEGSTLVIPILIHPGDWDIAPF